MLHVCVPATTASIQRQIVVDSSGPK